MYILSKLWGNTATRERPTEWELPRNHFIAGFGQTAFYTAASLIPQISYGEMLNAHLPEDKMVTRTVAESALFMAMCYVADINGRACPNNKTVQKIADASYKHGIVLTDKQAYMQARNITHLRQTISDEEYQASLDEFAARPHLAEIDETGYDSFRFN